MFYIDSEYKLHTTNPSGKFEEITLSEYAQVFFSGKCTEFIEGHRYVPINRSWTRSDGVEFNDEMITPWKPYNELAAAQAQYETDLAEAAVAYQEGVDSAYDQ